MSPKNASHNQHCLLDSTSTRTRFDYSSTSLPSHSRSSQADLLDPLDDITVDSDLDQRSASSSTLLSRRVSSSLFTNQLLTDANYASSESDLSTQLSESRQSRFLYSLRKPGQMTAQRTQRLRVRTAVVIMSIPATSEDVIDMDDHEPSNALKVPPVAPPSKLRRVSGVRDLRSAFCDGDHTLPSVSPMGPPKVCIKSPSRFSVYSSGAPGLIRTRHLDYTNSITVSFVPSFLTSHSGRRGKYSA